jgi:hypothetical protein
VGGFRREVQHSQMLGLTRKGMIILPASPPSIVFRRCEGGSGERKIEQVQGALVLHLASQSITAFHLLMGFRGRGARIRLWLGWAPGGLLEVRKPHEGLA